MPRVPVGQRIVVDGFGCADDGIIRVPGRFGYMETLDAPGTLVMLDTAQTESRFDEASYFLSKIDLRRGKTPRVAAWRHLVHHGRQRPWFSPGGW